MQYNLKSPALWIQLFATVILSLLATQTGFIVTWPSYTVAIYSSNETVLSRPMTSMDISWLGGISSVGGFCGSLFCGTVGDKIGRKYAAILFGLFLIISWVIIAATKSVPVVLIATFIAGIGVSGQKQTVIYISEISHDSIRGALTACSAAGYYFGMLLAHVVVRYLSYHHVLYLYVTLCSLSVFGIFLLKESPVFWMMVKKEEEAVKSIAFYNQVEVGSKLVGAEIRKIKQLLDDKPKRSLQGDKDEEARYDLIDNKSDAVVSSKESQWELLKQSQSSRKALFTLITITTLAGLMGNTALQAYTEPLFKQAVPSISSNLCAISLAVVFLVASCICVVVIDKCGRKNLLSVTSVLSGVCTVLLGVQLQFSLAPQWMTAFLIYLYSFVFTLGCASMPAVLMSEVFLPEVRNFCSTIIMSYSWVSSFLILFVFHPLVEAFGLGVVFYFFSVFCFANAIFVQFRLPETNGLSTNNIQKAFLEI